jgi:hypothetical protein
MQHSGTHGTGLSTSGRNCNTGIELHIRELVRMKTSKVRSIMISIPERTYLEMHNIISCYGRIDEIRG